MFGVVLFKIAAHPSHVLFTLSTHLFTLEPKRNGRARAFYQENFTTRKSKKQQKYHQKKTEIVV